MGTRRDHGTNGPPPVIDEGAPDVPEGDPEGVEEDRPPTDWMSLRDRIPAEEALARYIWEEPWEKVTVPKGAARPEPHGIIVQKRNGPGNSPYEPVFSISSKEGRDIAAAFDRFLDAELFDDPDPGRIDYHVKRFSKPDLKQYDSSRTFILVNSAYLARNPSMPADTRLPTLRERDGVDIPGTTGVGYADDRRGLPISIFTGPSPAGIDPSRYGSPAGVPSPPSAIVGDIGGTGLATQAAANVQVMRDANEIIMKVHAFHVDASMRLLQAVGAILVDSPRADVERAKIDHERYKLDHDLRLAELQGVQTQELERTKEVGGIVRDLGGKVLENDAFGAGVLAIASRVTGASPRQIMDNVGRSLAGDGEE